MLTRWRVGNSTFLALPEKGARLMNWNITLGDGSVRDVLYWPEDADLGAIAQVRGGNPILFPFNGRCFDRGDIFFWRAADGVRRPIPIHGIARQGDFKTLRVDARGFVAQFLPGEEARASYPFDYEFTVTYRFEPFGLACEFALTNLGREPLPWSAGHHFYFTLPWSEGTTRGRLSDSNSSREAPATGRDRRLGGRDRNCRPTRASRARPSSTRSIPRCAATRWRLEKKGREGDITVRLGTEKIPPPEATFVTWTLADDSPFYCVEPWMGPANAPEHKVGLYHVAPGETQKFAVSIRVR